MERQRHADQRTGNDQAERFRFARAVLVIAVVITSMVIVVSAIFAVGRAMRGTMLVRLVTRVRVGTERSTTVVRFHEFACWTVLSRMCLVVGDDSNASSARREFLHSQFVLCAWRLQAHARRQLPWSKTHGFFFEHAAIGTDELNVDVTMRGCSHAKLPRQKS